MVHSTSKSLAKLLVFLFISNIIAETHVVLDQLDKTVINFVAESPFVIHQPHSLLDFLNQIKWVEELSKSYSTIKRQQVSIEKRYDDDDPEIEKKIRSTDPNCVESQPLDLQTENFIKTYTSDLAPNFILHSDLPMITTYYGVPSTLDTFQLNYLHRLFSIETSMGKFREPYCETYVFSAWANEIASEGESLSDVPEPDFTELDESKLLKIATFLTERLEEEKNARWASYYSSFYWRIKGNSKAALRCLLYNLDLDPEPIAAKFQLATLYLRHGKYSKAIQYLESVTKRVDNCHECRLALADALVLDGNFQAATVAYEEVYKKNPDYTIAHKKMALLRCVLRVFEEMENQHTHLLDTIQDVNEYKEKLKRLKGLEALIESNRASPEVRLQAKLAYQYYTLGPMPHLSCRGLTKPAENGKPELSRLYCGVDNWKLYNESLIDKYQQQLLSAKTKKIDSEINQVELFETEKLRYEKLANAEMDEYLTKLSPFVAMRADEPQLSPKYPLNNDRKSSVKFFKRTWPSIEECEKKFFPEDHLELAPFFLSPENKGFIVSDLLTKYLALDSATDISPLPWQTPDCELVNSSDEDMTFGRESIEEMLDGGSKNPFVKGKKLKSALLNLVEPSHSKIAIGDLGNRISLLLKYNIGPRWISTNLAALFYRYLGMTNQAVNCLKEAIMTNMYKDHWKMAQMNHLYIIFSLHTPIKRQ
uniref:Uncharacterized protein n=1 Tax=Ditylenchus dipsaci TaxID=166011 RepID=A0A915CY43_9BILA